MLTEVPPKTGPYASRRHLFSVPSITDGYARASVIPSPQPLRGCDCTLRRLFALVGGARPAGDPVDSDPGARLPSSPPEIEPKLAKALDVSPHPGADGPVQGELPPSTCTLTVFTSLACYPGALPHCHRNTVGCGAGTSEDCRPHTTG